MKLIWGRPVFVQLEGERKLEGACRICNNHAELVSLNALQKFLKSEAVAVKVAFNPSGAHRPRPVILCSLANSVILVIACLCCFLVQAGSLYW